MASASLGLGDSVSHKCGAEERRLCKKHTHARLMYLYLLGQSFFGDMRRFLWPWVSVMPRSITAEHFHRHLIASKSFLVFSVLISTSVCSQFWGIWEHDRLRLTSCVNAYTRTYLLSSFYSTFKKLSSHPASSKEKLLCRFHFGSNVIRSRVFQLRKNVGMQTRERGRGEKEDSPLSRNCAKFVPAKIPNHDGKVSSERSRPRGGYVWST